MAAKVKKTRLRPGTKVAGRPSGRLPSGRSAVSALSLTWLSTSSGIIRSGPSRAAQSDSSVVSLRRTGSRNSISMPWRWPYSKPMVSTRRKRSSAQARHVVESWPAENSTSAASASSATIRSAAAEQLLDFGEAQRDVGGPAVIALAGMRRRFHLAQQRVHLGLVETPSGAHAAVTGDGAADMLEPFLERQRAAEFGELVGEIAHQPFDVGLAEDRRHFAHHHRAGTKGLEH